MLVHQEGGNLEVKLLAPQSLHHLKKLGHMTEAGMEGRRKRLLKELPKWRRGWVGGLDVCDVDLESQPRTARVFSR